MNRYRLSQLVGEQGLDCDPSIPGLNPFAEPVDVYLASEADDVLAGASQALQNAKARIRELEKRLVACESAMLVGCDTSHRAIVGYMQTYPDPYSGS